MLTDIYHAIVYFVVPGILLALLVAAIFASQVVPRELRLSARAGLCAGLVAFAIYVASSFENFQAPPHSAKTLPEFHWIPALSGLVLGFALLMFLQVLKFVPALIGLLTLLLVASTSSAAFSYFYISRQRDYTIYFALSVLLGVLLYIIFFSRNETVREMLNREGGRWD